MINRTIIKEAETIVCKNCSHAFEGNFCNQCGQPSTVGKLDSHFLLHELQHGVFHFDQGIFYTIKELFIEPGKFLRSYLDGKRARHFKPVAFLIILSGLYAFITHQIGSVNIMRFYNSDNDITARFQTITEWNNEHYLLYVLIVLPLTALICFLVYKKQGVTYLEHLVINAYLSGQKFIFSLILLFALQVFDEENGFLIVLLFNIILPSFYFIWSYTAYFAPEPKLRPLRYAISAFTIYLIVNMVMLECSLALVEHLKK